MLDGVFNHVGTAHPSFRAAMAGDERAQELFRLEHTDAGVVHQDFEGHRGLAALNHDSEAVVELVADVMRHWLRRGAAAWRLDAAYAVPPEFWARVLPRVREEFPVYLARPRNINNHDLADISQSITSALKGYTASESD